MAPRGQRWESGPSSLLLERPIARNPEKELRPLWGALTRRVGVQVPAAALRRETRHERRETKDESKDESEKGGARTLVALDARLSTLVDNPALMRLRELEVPEKIATAGDLKIVLGEKRVADTTPAIGRGLGAPGFWPGAVAFDGSYLLVGEFKFSGRVLRCSLREQ